MNETGFNPWTKINVARSRTGRTFVVWETTGDDRGVCLGRERARYFPTAEKAIAAAERWVDSLEPGGHVGTVSLKLPPDLFADYVITGSVPA